MKFPFAKTAAFLLACVLTGTAWHALWPAPAVTVITSEITPSREPAVTPSAARTAVAELIAAGTKEEQMRAASKLAEIPIEEIPALLDSIEVYKNRELTLAAKTLLIRWGSADGEAAARWAWLRLREDGLFGQALSQIGPAWAWHDPRGLAGWADQRLTEQGPRPSDTPSLEETLAMESPALDSRDCSKIAAWIVKDEPRLAFALLIKRGGSSDDDRKLVDSLGTVERVREALLAFDHFESLDLNPKRFSAGPETHAKALLNYWRKLDPGGFAASSYGKYLEVPRYEKTADEFAKWRDAAAEERLPAAERLLDALPEESRPGMVSSLTQQWAASDPAACRAWLEALPGDLPAAGARSFAGSAAAAHLDEVADYTGTLPPLKRQNCLVDAHRAWRAAHPDEEADTSAWSEPVVEVWNGLEALRKLSRR